MTKRKLYVQLAGVIDARARCMKSGNDEWIDKHTDTIEALAEQLPHGAGFNSGTSVDLDASTGEKIVLNCIYDHYAEHGHMSSSDLTVTVTASLVFGFELDIQVDWPDGLDEDEELDRDYEVYYFSEQFAEYLDVDVEPYGPLT